MPTTSYNIDQVLRYVHNYTRQQVLQAFDEVQKMVYGHEGEETIYIDPLTGLPPLFPTTNNIYEYNCPSDCRRVAALITAQPFTGYSRTRPAPTYGRHYYFRGQTYYQVRVHSYDGRREDSTLARIVIPFNPGDTTDRYLLMYYQWIDDLTDVNQQLQLPEHVHWRFRKAVIELLGSDEYGDHVASENIIEKQVKKLRSQLNQGANTIHNRTAWQPEHMEFSDESFGHGRTY